MNDHCRSNVPVENTAAIAAVHALDQCLCGDRSALRAGLRSPARIDADELAPGSLSLVCEHLNQLRPRGVVDVLGEHSGRQAFDVEVFDRYPAEAADYIAANLVQGIAPSIGDARLELCKSALALGSDVRSALASGKRTLAAAQPLSGALSPIRAFSGRAGRKRDEVGKPDIDADSKIVRPLGCRNLDVKDDIPLAVLARQDRGLRLTGQVAMPANLDFAGYANESDLSGLAQRQPIANAELGCVEPGARPEAREAVTAAEERAERFFESAQHLLLSGEGPARQLGYPSADRFQFRRLVAVAQALSAPPICFDALLQRGVIDVAEVGEHFRQKRGLRSVRIDPVFVGEKHRINIGIDADIFNYILKAEVNDADHG